MLVYTILVKYATHNNPLEVYCASCGRDITLEAQEILKSEVYCEECLEPEEEEEDRDY